MKDNIKLLDTGEKNEVRAAIEKAKRDMGHMAEAAAVAAQLRRLQFLAYIEAGFTERQALFLCRP